MIEYTFTKGTVEKYDIRWNRGEWAVFTIDNETGLMQCHSSYGDWGYGWPSHGRKTFKHFILELERDSEYLLKKVSNEIFDFEGSIKRWKRLIIDWRKEESCKKEEAREAYDFLKNLSNDDNQSYDYCFSKLLESEEINNLNVCDFWEVFGQEKKWAAQDIVFAKTIWTMLCDIIRKEMKEGK